MSNNYKNLVFQGGGSAGEAYIGALAELEALEKEGKFSFKDLKRIAGTSVGAITAMMVALGYTSEEISQRLSKVNFNDLKVGGYGVFGDIYRLDQRYGIYQHSALHQLIKDLVKEKMGDENATFADLKAKGLKSLYVVATKIYTRDGSGTSDPVVFSEENAANTPIASAVLASACIPGVFECVRLEDDGNQNFKLSQKGHIYVDGGLVNNYPIHMFDKQKYLHPELKDNDQPEKSVFNNETLGLRLVNKEEIDDYKDHKPVEQTIPDGDPKSVLIALINGLSTGRQDYIFRNTAEDKTRSVYIDRLGVSATDNLTPQAKENLVKSGKLAVTQFFKPEAVEEKVATVDKVATPLEINTPPSSPKESFVMVSPLRSNSVFAQSPVKSPVISDAKEENRVKTSPTKSSFCSIQ